jgi:hypothetical protein
MQYYSGSKRLRKCAVVTLAPRETKKPTWQNTLRHSTTPAYSTTSLPAMLGCSSSSHPTKSDFDFTAFSTVVIVQLETDKAKGFLFVVYCVSAERGKGDNRGVWGPLRSKASVFPG